MFKSNTFQVIIIYNNASPIILTITHLFNYAILFFYSQLSSYPEIITRQLPNYPDNNNLERG